MPSSFDKQDTRLLIVAAAAHGAALGAHYINGADGGITGKNSADEGGVNTVFRFYSPATFVFQLNQRKKLIE